jgi:hypothetical protein
MGGAPDRRRDFRRFRRPIDRRIGDRRDPVAAPRGKRSEDDQKRPPDPPERVRL